MIAIGTKTVLAACLVATLWAAPAFACRGTHEYSEVAVKLASADLPPAEKAALQKRLDEGQALHERGHKEDDQQMKMKSLEILDGIKAKLGE